MVVQVGVEVEGAWVVWILAPVDDANDLSNETRPMTCIIVHDMQMWIHAKNTIERPSKQQGKYR